MSPDSHKHTQMAGNKDKPGKMEQFYDAFSSRVTRATGSPAASIIAMVVIVVWACLGPVFDFSDTWQLVINTGTTIVTFLMVFIIQQSQNKETTALQLKLNELIASNKNASNRLIDIEDLTDREVQVLKKFYVKLAALAAEEQNVFTTHSIDEAKENHEEKSETQRKQKQQSS